MDISTVLIILISLFLLSLWTTGLFIEYAKKNQLWDEPSERSLHLTTKPRGGGVVFVSLFLMALILLAYLNYLPIKLVLLITISGGLVALLGYLDDCGYLTVKWRLLGQIVAATFAAVGLGQLPSISLFYWIVPFYITLFAAIFYLTWTSNLYNFMDGINGLAAVEAISVSLGLIGILFFSGQYLTLLIPMVLMVTVSGFLYWNFPYAKIFMGDVGSGFLGMIIGFFTLYIGLINLNFFISGLILLAVFITDATLTLLVRIMNKAAITQSHCNHAYQHAAKKYGHTPVTLAVSAINLFWLIPWALGVAKRIILPELGLIVSYLPVIFLALFFKAGHFVEKI